MTATKPDLETYYAGLQRFQIPVGDSDEQADTLHIGGDGVTEWFGQFLDFKPTDKVLEIGSGLGGPACYLARKYGCDITGIEITEVNYREALRRTKIKGLDDKVHFELGDATAMPFDAGVFDVVYSIDAMAHVVERDRLIRECARVIKPGGIFAFTDWLQVGEMEQEERDILFTSLACEVLGTMEEYGALVRKHGFEILREEELTEELHKNCRETLEQMRTQENREAAVEHFGEEGYQVMDQMIGLWTRAAAEHKLGWGLFVGRKG